MGDGAAGPDLSWIYKAMPVDDPGLVLRGAMKAFLYKYIVPFYLLTCMIFILFWGIRIIPDLLMKLKEEQQMEENRKATLRRYFSIISVAYLAIYIVCMIISLFSVSVSMDQRLHRKRF